MKCIVGNFRAGGFGGWWPRGTHSCTLRLKRVQGDLGGLTPKMESDHWGEAGQRWLEPEFSLPWHLMTIISRGPLIICVSKRHYSNLSVSGAFTVMGLKLNHVGAGSNRSLWWIWQNWVMKEEEFLIPELNGKPSSEPVGGEKPHWKLVKLVGICPDWSMGVWALWSGPRGTGGIVSLIQVVLGLHSTSLPGIQMWGHFGTFCFPEAQTQVKFHTVTFSLHQPSIVSQIIVIDIDCSIGFFLIYCSVLRRKNVALHFGQMYICISTCLLANSGPGENASPCLCVLAWKVFLSHSINHSPLRYRTAGGTLLGLPDKHLARKPPFHHWVSQWPCLETPPPLRQQHWEPAETWIHQINYADQNNMERLWLNCQWDHSLQQAKATTSNVNRVSGCRNRDWHRTQGLLIS